MLRPRLIPWLPILPLLIAIPFSQFRSLELSIGQSYLGINCFGPYLGRTLLPPHIALASQPILRPLSLSTFRTLPTSFHNPLNSGFTLPWWLVALACLAPVVLLGGFRRYRASRAFPVTPAPHPPT